MDRRTFVRLVGTGTAAAAVWGLPARGAGLPPYAADLPSTPFAGSEDAWTLAVLPDTQNMVKGYPAAFYRQIDWIVAHAASHRIKFVAHEGDITNNNTAAEWERAALGFRRLRAAGIPYSLLTGNHDLGANGRGQDRTTGLNDFFDASAYSGSEASGLCEPGHLENSWHIFTAPTGRYLLLSLEFGPRDEVVSWAGKVLQEHATIPAIVVTHAYLFSDSTRFDRHGPPQRGNPHGFGCAKMSSVNDGEDLWRKLIHPHPQVRLVLSGHVGGYGTGYLRSTGTNGHAVDQILANYQTGVAPDRAYGGGAFLRLLQFEPGSRRIQVRTYSPWFDAWLTDSDQQFGFAYSS